MQFLSDGLIRTSKRGPDCLMWTPNRGSYMTVLCGLLNAATVLYGLLKADRT